MSRTPAEANFFASLVESAAVVAACEQSPALSALPCHKHSADKPGRRRTQELAEWDAAVDEGRSSAATRVSATRRDKATGNEGVVLFGMDDIISGVKLVELLS